MVSLILLVNQKSGKLKGPVNKVLLFFFLITIFHILVYILHFNLYSMNSIMYTIKYFYIYNIPPFYERLL